MIDNYPLNYDQHNVFVSALQCRFARGTGSYGATQTFVTGPVTLPLEIVEALEEIEGYVRLDMGNFYVRFIKRVYKLGSDILPKGRGAMTFHLEPKEETLIRFERIQAVHDYFGAKVRLPDNQECWYVFSEPKDGVKGMYRIMAAADLPKFNKDTGRWEAWGCRTHLLHELPATFMNIEHSLVHYPPPGQE